MSANIKTKSQKQIRTTRHCVDIFICIITENFPALYLLPSWLTVKATLLFLILLPLVFVEKNYPYRLYGEIITLSDSTLLMAWTQSSKNSEDMTACAG